MTPRRALEVALESEIKAHAYFTAAIPAILDPDVGINFAAMLHGSQEFEWSEPVCVGDVITTTSTCKEIYEKLK